MSTQIILQAAGLAVSPNQLSAPQGALSTASNVIIKRDNVVESRRGFHLYGTETATIIKQLMTYKNTIIRHFGSTLQWDTKMLNTDSQSIFNTFAGSFNEVDPGLRIKSIESNGNFYFTTSDGIKKISATSSSDFSTASGYIYNAGGIKAINGSARVDLELGNSTGFLPENSTVAYRFVWGRRDANTNIVLGAPSERVVIYVPLMEFLIPDFDRILGALDDITDTSTTAFIGDGDYVSTLALDETATPTDLQTQIIALAEKIDTDIFIAGSAAQPIQLDGGGSSSIVSGNVATITLNTGDFTQYFTVGSHVFLNGFSGSAAVLNGAQTLTDVTISTISFNITTANFNQTPTVAGSEIHSGEFRNTIANIEFQGTTTDLNTLIVLNPATGDQLQIMQQALSQIINVLQSEPTTIISAPNQTTYITPLDITTSANVILSINIPEAVDSNYFLQIYRSHISTATGTTVLSDLVPDDEMHLVYEAFPTSAELTAGMMAVEDIVVDAFVGANLYTNPESGEGIAQANDVPPLAKDINRFKNVVFYANTKTRQRVNLNLLGVQNFKAGNVVLVSAGGPPTTITTDEDHGLSTGDIVYINGTGIPAIDAKLWSATVLTDTTFTIPVSGGAGSIRGYWTNSMLAIISSTATNQYYFIKGMAEVTNVATVADVAGSLAGKYFLINSGKDYNQYYVWYKVSGSGTDPAISGKTGIQVNIATNDSANTVAFKTRNTLSIIPQDFIISGATNNVIITDVLDGVTTDGSAGTSGFTVTITQQGRGEDASKNEVLLSTLVSPAQSVDETARSLQNVINLNTAETVYVYYLSGLADVPGKMLFEGRGLPNPKFYVVANNSFVGNSFNPSITPNPNETITNTAANPTVVTATAHGLVSGNNAVIAFSNSSPSINGINLVTFLSANTFSINVNVTTAGTTGVMIKDTLAAFSEDEEKKNRIYYSKLQQPEAVPLVNFFDVGSQESAILRIFPIRDSLFVFKEDGLFRVSGEVAPFNLALFDSSCILLAADSLGLSNNLIYGFTTQGIHTVSESGVDIISRYIDIDILKLASANYPNFRTITWGVGYDSDNSYTVYTNSDPTDTVATLAYRFSNLTGTWTTIDKTETCGIINPDDDKMYTGAGDVNFIEQERKSFDRTDYADRELSKSLTDNSYFTTTQTIKLSDVSDIEIGDVLYQSQFVSVYNFNSLLQKLDLDATISFIPLISITTGSSPTITVKNFSFVPGDVNTGTDTITIPSHGFTTGERVRFVSSGALPAPLIANIDYYIKNPGINTFQLSTTNVGAVINLTTAGTGTHIVFKYHNLSVGDSVKVNSLNSDPVLNGVFEVESVINGYSFTISVSAPITTAGTSGTIGYSYFDNLQMAAGNNIRTKLLALVAILDTDPGLQLNNYASIIGAKSGVIISNTATNPTVINATAHGLKTGRFVSITGTNSVPTFDGNYIVTVVDANHFSVPVSITISGTAGSFNTLNSSYQDLLGCYNAITTNLNLDPGPIFNNYHTLSDSVNLETLITNVNNFTKEITIAQELNFLVGPLIVFKAIETDFVYSNITMGDPLGWKHLLNFTMMFENKAFTSAVVSFATDLLPEFIPVPFNGDGNGIFGFTIFGRNFFGGGSHGAPFRTIFPKQIQRCRYLSVKYTHRIAREKWSSFGITIDGSISQSTRAYRR